MIGHDATPGAGESANARNLRILTEEFAEGFEQKFDFTFDQKKFESTIEKKIESVLKKQ